MPVLGHYTGNALPDWVDWTPALGIFALINNVLPAGIPIPPPQTTVSWGLNGDIPVGGDYDGDGINDFTVFRPVSAGPWSGTWFIKPSTGTCPSYTTVLSGGCYKQWGIAGDIPVPNSVHHN